MDQTQPKTRFRPQAYLAYTEVRQPAFWNVLIMILSKLGVTLNHFSIESTSPEQLTGKLYVLLPPSLPGGTILNLCASRDQCITFANEARMLFPARQCFLVFTPSDLVMHKPELGIKVTNNLVDILDSCSYNPELLEHAQINAIVTTEMQNIGCKLLHDLRALSRNGGDDDTLRNKAITFIANVGGTKGNNLDSLSCDGLCKSIEVLLR